MDNNYVEAYCIKRKEVEGVGMSFSGVSRNVDKFV